MIQGTRWPVAYRFLARLSQTLKVMPAGKGLPELISDNKLEILRTNEEKSESTTRAIE